MRIWLVALTFLLTALAGCTNDSGGSEAGSTDMTDGASDMEDMPQEEQEENVPTETDPITGTLYIQTDGTLGAEESAAGRIPIPASTSGTYAGVTESEVLHFESSAFLRPAVIQPKDITFTAWVESNAPTIANGFYDFGAWVGSTVNMPASQGVTIGPTALVPGTPMELTITLANPATDGSFIPVDGRMVAEFHTGLVDENGDRIDLLVGPDHPSRIEITWTIISEDILGGVDTSPAEQFSGHFDTDSLAGGDPSTYNAEHVFTIPVDAQVVRLESSADSPKRVDLDLTLLDGDAVLGRGASFFAEESIYLAGPTLEPYLGKEVTLQVTNYIGNDVDYTVDMSIG